MGRLPEDQISREQWKEYVEGPEKEGCSKVQIMSREKHEEQYKGEAKGEDWQAKAAKDVQIMQECIKAMGNRKATRRGEAPAEMWKILMCKRQITHERTKKGSNKEPEEVVIKNMKIDWSNKKNRKDASQIPMERNMANFKVQWQKMMQEDENGARNNGNRKSVPQSNIQATKQSKSTTALLLCRRKKKRGRSGCPYYNKL